MKKALIGLMFLGSAAFAGDNDATDFTGVPTSGRCQEGYTQRIPDDGYCSNGQKRDSVYQCQGGQMVRISYTCRRDAN